MTLDDQDSPRERIKISVPETYKQTDDGVWSELEKYLFTGFLVNPASIAGHSFVFKTLNHFEIKNIEFMKPARSAPSDAKSIFRHCFIAYSIFMIDGVNVLFERQKNMSKIIKVVSKIPPNSQEKIISHLASINTQAHRLHSLTEVYVGENRSKYKWLQIQNMPIHSALATGISGTDELGMNYSQLTWVALNRIYDRKDAFERDWTNAKFIGSCFAGKGVKTVDERDKARAEREKTEQEEKKIEVLQAYLNHTPYGEERRKQTQLADGRMATIEKNYAADSVEELSVQLESALNGEKDWHDSVVEKQLEKLRRREKNVEKVRSQVHMLTPQQNESGTRVIGSRSDADAYVSRLEAMRVKQIEAGRQAAIDAMMDQKESPPNEESE